MNINFVLLKGYNYQGHDVLVIDSVGLSNRVYVIDRVRQHVFLFKDNLILIRKTIDANKLAHYRIKIFLVNKPILDSLENTSQPNIHTYRIKR